MQSNQHFEKSAECPTNESLLAFLQAEQDEASAEELRIVEHLAICEFCELSLELLRNHPAPSLEPFPSPPPVPNQIKQLFQIRRVHK